MRFIDLASQRIHVADETMFCSAIRGSQRRTYATRYRAYRHNMAAPSIGHTPQLQLRQPNGRNKVNVDKLGIDFWFCINGDTALTNTRVVNQNVDPTSPCPRAVHDISELIIVGDLKG